MWPGVAEHEAHRHASSSRHVTWVRILQSDAGVVLVGDLQHDRQAQPRSVHIGAKRAIERLEHQLAFRFRNPRPRILHLQYPGKVY